jgi:two-component system, chemotaxis family, sensor kinase CheA
MTPLHEQFVTETRELILQASDDLIALERDGFDSERIDRILRSFHTLKGSAGVVRLPAMSLLLHAAEDVMIAVQNAQIFAGSVVISELLNSLDQVAQWIDTFESTEALPPNAGEDARVVAERLRQNLSSKAESATKTPEAGKFPEWASRLVQSVGEDASGLETTGSQGLFAIRYEPHAGCFYDGDDPLRLLRAIPDLLTLHMEIPGPEQALSDLDPFACRLRLEALARGTRYELSTIFQSVPDQVRIIDVPREALPAGAHQSECSGKALVLAVVAEQREVLHVAHRSDIIVGCLGAAARAAAAALRQGLRGDLAERVTQAGAAAMADRNAAALVAALEEALEQLTPGPRRNGPDDPSSSPAVTKRSEKESPATRSLRVEQSRIESLVNLAGELIVLKNSFGHLAKRIEDEKGSRDLIRAVRHEYDGLERLAGDMQRAVLQLRMVPFAQVLRPLPRLVRDLSQQLGKNTHLVTNGETTESDKTVVDRLFEPLLHLVRNALDHGIESPDERTAAGKDRTATITIQASRAGDRIVVDVTDDGRGIDPAIVRQKAVEKGLLTHETATALSDEKILEVIFSAGFSTAAQASDISGRGVGMDVVRTSVEQIGGRVSLDSHVGKGTRVRLDVPMNIATSRIMVVECAGQAFGIPMDHVVETVRLTPDRIREIKNNEGFVLRDRVVPICSLAELMNLPRATGDGRESRLVMVADTGGKVAAVEIDAIRDRLDVVLKPMQGVLANAHGYAGTTLLGDGAVLLIVDLQEVLA